MTINILNTKTDSDGRQEVRALSASKGATMYYSGPTFTASKIGLQYDVSSDNPHWKHINPKPPFTPVDRGWSSVKLYRDDNTEITDVTYEDEARWTQLDIIVPHDIELIGGAFAIPNTLPSGDASSGWHVWVFAAPEIPEALGGEISMVEDIVINDFYEGEDVIIDGRAPKMLRYLDFSNYPTSQWAANLGNAATINAIIELPTGNPEIPYAPISAVATTLQEYLTYSGYDGANLYGNTNAGAQTHTLTTGDIILLMMGETDPETADYNKWQSYMYNGGVAGTTADWDYSITDFGSGAIQSAPLNYAWWQNQLRFIIKHPKGLNPSTQSGDIASFQVILDTFIKWN